MHRDEVTTPRRGSDHGTSSATRSGKFAVPDSRNSRDMALSSALTSGRTFVAKVQAMAPYSLRRVGGSPTRR
jgi:hypothetical protein